MASVVYGDSTYRTEGDLPAVGSYAPDISLVDTRLKAVTMSNWIGMRKIVNVVLSVDVETCAESIIEFERLGADQPDLATLTVSRDLPFTHARFAAEHKLGHVVGLSAIRHAGFGENYGVQIAEGPLAGMFARAVVVIDENNTVVHSELLEDFAHQPDYPAAFRALGLELA